MNWNIIIVMLIVILVALSLSACKRDTTFESPNETVNVSEGVSERDTLFVQPSETVNVSEGVSESEGLTYEIQFIDQSTNLPIPNEDVEVYAIIECKIGGDCDKRILFNGKTNYKGVVIVPEEIIKLKMFGIQISSGRFKDHGTEIRHKRIHTGKWRIEVPEWSKDIVEVYQFNNDGTKDFKVEFNITQDTPIVKLLHKDYWK